MRLQGYSYWAVSIGIGLGGASSLLACETSGASNTPNAAEDASAFIPVDNDSGSAAQTGDDAAAVATGEDGGNASTPNDAGHSHHDAGSSDAGTGGSSIGVADASAPNPDGGYPAGWLYTSGSKIYVSNGGATGTQWMGRGVNIDDIYFCGFNSTLTMANPDKTLETEISNLMTGWKPTFLRISLAMDTDTTKASWLTNPAQYETPMTNVIKAIGGYSGVHVLVTLRSDASMIGQDETDGDPEATGLPSDATNTPNATAYPNGTDDVYVALVDSFGSLGAVMFGLTNEPGGDKLSNDAIAAAMTHAVGVIRAEEDKLGVPHHIVSVQGNAWTSNISFYSTSPLPYDNVVYEVHGYPPATTSYTYSNIPVIVGEYGSLTSSASFYADLESKQLPNLAWDFDPYSDCSPDLLTVNESVTSLVPTTWGSTVQAYLLAH